MRFQTESTDHGASPIIGVILIVAVTIILASVISIFVLDITEDVNDPQPALSLSASFDVREEIDPHWIFNLTHRSGEVIGEGNMKIKLIDNFGSEANQTYPKSFAAGDRIRMGLWGSPSRAGSSCVKKPVAAPNAGDNQLNDTDPPSGEVTIIAIHEPSNSIMDEVDVNLDEFPDRYNGGIRLVDGARPSFDCDDVDF